MSYTSQPTNSQSLNGIITLTDGVITIEDGTITGLDEIDLTDLQVSGTATIENLVVNNQIDMTLGQIKNVSAPTDNGDATNKQYVDTNYLNKVITTSQSVASRLTFNNTTSGSSFPIIELQNAITGSNNGMYLRFFKNISRLPNTEIGSIVFADKNPVATTRAVQLKAEIDSVSKPLFNIIFDTGDFNPLTISNTLTILRCDDFYIKNKTGAQNLLYYTSSNDFWAMSKSLNMAQNNITNVGDLMINNQIDMTSGKIINLADPTLAQEGATKNYVDTHSANNNYLLRNGTLPMLGNLQMGSYKITNLLDPDDLNDGANKYYVDTQTANTHYLLRNGTLAMTGALNMGTTHKIINLAEPTLAQDASTKNYTDTASVNTNYLKRDGSLTMLGTLNMNSNLISNLTDPVSAQQASTKNYVDTHSNNNNYLLKTGGTMTGAILMNSTTQINLNNNPSDGNGARIYYNTTNKYTHIDTRGDAFIIQLDNSANPTQPDEKIRILSDETIVKNNFNVQGAIKYKSKNITANYTLEMDTPTTGDVEDVFICKGSGITIKFPDTNKTYWRSRWVIIKSGSNNNTTIDFNGNNYEGQTGTMTLGAYRQASLYFDTDFGVGTIKDVWNITGQSNAP